MPDMTAAPAAQSVTLPQELGALVALSGPLALSNLAQIAMGTTDVMMMGSLGPDTLAAGALGADLYLVALIFGIGLLNATTPMIARELGRGSSTGRDLRRIVQQGFWSVWVDTRDERFVRCNQQSLTRDEINLQPNAVRFQSG
jgi:multidrug resistance protein, MATE family